MTREQPVRLSDLARAAGVSTATASRVLNGRPGVKDAKRAAVLAAASELGYSLPPDASRPALRGPVAIMTGELGNPSFAAFAEVTDSFLHDVGLTSFVCPATLGGTSEADNLTMLESVGVSGIVSISGMPANADLSLDPYRATLARGVPAVFINAPADGLPAASYSTSDAEAINASVTHLRSMGHTRIGLAVGPLNFKPARRKARAFRALGFDEASIAVTAFTPAGGQVAAQRLLASGHTALVCGSDVMALGAIREARVQGLEVPRDVSIVGYDDSHLMAYTDPPLTTIRQPVRLICQTAVQGLLRAMDGDTTDTGEVLFHPDLVIRGSTAPVPGSARRA